MRKKIIAGNWKMNKNPVEAVEFVTNIKEKINTPDCDVVLCVPSIDLIPVLDCVNNTNIKVGAQNMFCEEHGAYTGEISAEMLKTSGVEFVILGHSERRTIFGESDSLINKKVAKALEYGISPIICVGETLEQRENNMTIELVRIQIKNTLHGVTKSETEKIIIAYEPIWAIGTGKTATSIQAQEVCHEIRNVLTEIYDEDTANKIRIQYGGSVNSKNAKELFEMPDIDGGLVGGASLKEEFISIVNYN